MTDLAKNAKSLLLAGLLGGHLIGISMVTVAFLWFGPVSGGSTLLGVALVLAFFAIGQGVQVLTANADPQVVLGAAMASYAIRVGLLGVLLAYFLNNPHQFQLDDIAIVISVIGTVSGWLTAEIIAFTRLRIPVFDQD